MRRILSEITTGELINITVRVFSTLKKTVTFPDIMTDIRILPGVAIVRQISPVQRSKKGREVIDVTIRYHDAQERTPEEYMTELGRAIRHLEGVDLVKFLQIDDSDVSATVGRPLIF